MKKLRVKTIRPAGKYRSFSQNTYQILRGPFVVGSLDIKSAFPVALCVVKDEKLTDSNPNCDWTRVRLTKQFPITYKESKAYYAVEERSRVDEIKTWLSRYSQEIARKYNLAELEA